MKSLCMILQDTLETGNCFQGQESKPRPFQNEGFNFFLESFGTNYSGVHLYVTPDAHPMA